MKFKRTVHVSVLTFKWLFVGGLLSFSLGSNFIVMFLLFAITIA